MAIKAQDPSDIRNWRRRPDGITTSGRLEARDPARLADIGVKHVINLALDNHPEALGDEEELLASKGIGYTHIPVPFDDPTYAHVQRLREAIEQAEGAVHVHCIMNYRVSAFFFLLDLANGISREEAHARMAQVWDPLSSEDPVAQPWKQLLSGARPG